MLACMQRANEKVDSLGRSFGFPTGLVMDEFENAVLAQCVLTV